MATVPRYPRHVSALTGSEWLHRHVDVAQRGQEPRQDGAQRLRVLAPVEAEGQSADGVQRATVELAPFEGAGALLHRHHVDRQEDDQGQRPDARYLDRIQRRHWPPRHRQHDHRGGSDQQEPDAHQTTRCRTTGCRTARWATGSPATGHRTPGCRSMGSAPSTTSRGTPGEAGNGCTADGRVGRDICRDRGHQHHVRASFGCRYGGTCSTYPIPPSDRPGGDGCNGCSRGSGARRRASRARL